MPNSMISMDDVLLYRVGENGCASPRPKEGDEPALTAIKAFIMTCLHRRNMDPDFEHEMKEWLDSHTPEQLASNGIMSRFN